MDSAESVFPLEIIIVAAAVLISISVSFLMLRFIKRKTQYSGDPAGKETVYGYIESVRETGWFINNRPKLEFQVRIFPLDGPSRTVSLSQVIPFVHLFNMQPGKYVSVLHDGEFKSLHIEGPKPYEVTGAPFDMRYFDELKQSLSHNLAQEAEGEIISAEQTDTMVDALPVYRIRASYTTTDGNTVEGVTFRVCRPWFVGRIAPGNTVKIAYSKLDPEIFTIIE